MPIHEKVKYMLLVQDLLNIDMQIMYPQQTRGETKAVLINCKIKNECGKQQTNYCIPSLINELPISLKQDLTTKKHKILT